jgi:hypothetical protein
VCRIEKFDGDLNSFNFVNKEVALGETESMLAGIPL